LFKDLEDVKAAAVAGSLSLYYVWLQTLYRVSQTDRGNGTGLGVRYCPLAVGHGACQCHMILHVKS